MGAGERYRVAMCGALLVLAGCTPATPNPASPAPPATITATTTGGASPVTPTPGPSPTARPFDRAAALATVAHLADYGPREARSAAYRKAAEWVRTRFESYGYTVSSQEFPIPAGKSWGISVHAGYSHNVIADPPGFDPAAPHLVIGAHLDTVPQSPGAEDNASGVAVMLELARMLAEQPAGLPVRFIAFGAEEPRGSGDRLHHFGSQYYVAQLGDTARSVKAMVALDRVGAPGPAVPISFGGKGTGAVRDQLVAAAGTIPVTVRESNRTSDHWSFEKAGIPAARLGSIPYAGYHSAGDVPSVVDGAQLAAAGAITWNWLRAQPA
ncbi:M28 family metallopeptidase [Granulicoccus phenolivorans]|uniref:M28 family metallopeptidase n=1 Tax=Granulicoccus phenolivorans TaxID=266854 RepID=UPI00068745A0|nr:M20/M25/M40 family metallo-hydrolase [Granulicoccus phenolivorans]